MKIISIAFAALSIFCSPDTTSGEETTFLRGGDNDVDQDNNAVTAHEDDRHRRLGVLRADCIRLFEHPNYGGKYHEVCRDWSKPYDKKEDFANHNRRWNDNISSLQVGWKVRLWVYEHGSYGGYNKEFKGNVPDLRKEKRGRHSWDDCISGVKLVNNEPRFGDDCIRFYEHGWYKGNHYTVCGINKQVDFWLHVKDWNDVITSLKVGKNVAVRVFEHGLFQGFVAEFHHDIPDLHLRDRRRGQSWGDAISSFKIVSKDHTPTCGLFIRHQNTAIKNQDFKCDVRKQGQSCQIRTKNEGLPENFNSGTLTFKTHICTCKVIIASNSDSGVTEYRIPPYSTAQPKWIEGYYRRFTADCWM